MRAERREKMGRKEVTEGNENTEEEERKERKV